MDKEALNQQLLQLMKALEQEGFVDEKFRLCHSLKEISGPFFFVELIPTFLTDVRTVLRDITAALDQSVVDYNDMYEYCIKLRGSATSIGASQMKNACSNLRQAVDNKSKDGHIPKYNDIPEYLHRKTRAMPHHLLDERCLLALNDIKHEYFSLRSKWETIVQLERRIVSPES